MKHRIIILFLVFITTGCNIKEDRLELERDVYASVISYMGGDKAKILVFREGSTTNRGDFGDPQSQKKPDDEVYIDYIEMNKSSTRLPVIESWNKKVQLISNDELKSIFNKQSLELGWESYYKRFPGAGGIFGFSRVGFNNDLNKALVYFEVSCGPLCGNGIYVWLSKGFFGWKVDRTENLWVS